MGEGLRQFCIRHGHAVVTDEVRDAYHRWYLGKMRDWGEMDGARQEGYTEGLEEGLRERYAKELEEGHKEVQDAIARQAFAIGLPVDRVSALTGISATEIGQVLRETQQVAKTGNSHRTSRKMPGILPHGYERSPQEGLEIIPRLETLYELDEGLRQFCVRYGHTVATDDVRDEYHRWRLGQMRDWGEMDGARQEGRAEERSQWETWIRDLNLTPEQKRKLEAKRGASE
jgi:hypothetical protein